MSRWKYKVASVTVDENTVSVRGLTAGERMEFAEQSRKAREERAAASESPTVVVRALPSALAVPRLVAKLGVVDPPLTDEDVETMPGDLLDAVVTKILELSGVKSDEKDEKKDAALRH